MCSEKFHIWSRIFSKFVMFLKIERSCNTSLALKCQGKKWINSVNNNLKIPERVLCELTNSRCALVVSLGLTLGKY